MVSNLTQAAKRKVETPSEWIETNFYVPDPRDPVTGELLPPGPIRLAPHQRRIIDEALSKDEKGYFKYSTIVYSAPKKSGKSAITSAVVLFVAYHQPNSFAACLANDGQQANDRLYGPIYTNFRMHRQYGGLFKDVEPKLWEATLANFTKIRAVPCDAAGEAGSQPVISAWSELWGVKTDAKRRLFTEMTIPPTLHGKAIRWIETYAGFSGESELLEQIYDLGFTRAEPHPDFLDLIGENGPVVRVNTKARTFVYWDTEPRMLWQLGTMGEEFYQSEAAMLPPSEFERVHRNRWVSSLDSFVQESWWDACHNDGLPVLRPGDKTPVVVGIDMAVTRDCAALVAVTRDPDSPLTRVAVRGVRIFSPKAHGGIIDQETLIRPVLEEWSKKWNIVCYVYDPREMSKLAQDLTRSGMGWFKPFGQQTPRSIADKQLHDMILHREISWNHRTTEGDVGTKGIPGETLYKHIAHAGAATQNESYRLEKLSAATHIDGAVALSQAAYMAMLLAISNTEHNPDSLIRQLQRHEITIEEFSNRMKEANSVYIRRDESHGRPNY